MKKAYTSPEITVVAVDTESHILAGSGNDGDGHFNIGDPSSPIVTPGNSSGDSFGGNIGIGSDDDEWDGQG